MPGAVVVFSGGSARFHALALRGGSLVLGRDELAGLRVVDGRVSRSHLGLAYDGAAWTIRDRGSTNGVFVDGAAIDGEATRTAPRVLRIGHTLIVPVVDVTPFALHGLQTTEERVVGPRLRVVLEQIAAVGRAGHGVLVTGPSGAGKEHAARVFHAARGAKRPFVALNCATIPAGLAERVLFGARRGAYSGAVEDAKGLVQAADGGTLFLDEVADLEPAVQTKLLRALETKEVLPVGATQATRVEFTLCAATLKELRAEVLAGRFREDLYFRIGRPEFRLPALAERPEEIPWHVERALAEIGRAAPDVSLVERCLMCPWPGNVRELITEVRAAAIAAGQEPLVLARHLAPAAGESLTSAREAADAAATDSDHPIAEALRAEQGNVSQAAARLGVSRAKVRRFVEKAGLDVGALRRRG
ncbi:MAG: sigma-54-dependent Fis family transcriptional regulator [Myxococcales bacterium]|nr:sigma-54-dependent Fis family transcriptional regulator [Myxococcales bacterium]